jgi:methanol metabolism-related c-type cytochrome
LTLSVLDLREPDVKRNPVLSSVVVVAMATLFAAAFAASTYAADQNPASNKDGKYFDANGAPTYKIDPDGKVDWHTFSGYIRYSSECLRCHGPDGMGSTEGPALVDAVKSMKFDDFQTIVAQGKKDLGAGQEKVMPPLGLDKNVMCYISDIYIYLKARADGALPRDRPKSHEPQPKSAQDAENSCMGS